MTNVAVVVLDTLRKDAFDKHFDWLPGVRYENAWSPSGWTIPVHGALFGGAYPCELGVHAKAESLSCERDVLAEQLSQAGYTTRGFSANGYVCETFDFDRGFDEFGTTWQYKWRPTNTLDTDVALASVDFDVLKGDDRPGGIRRYLQALGRCFAPDVDTAKSLRHGLKLFARGHGIVSEPTDLGGRIALDALRNTDFGSDEFLFLNLVEAHAPYDPPESYKTVDVESSFGIETTVQDGPSTDSADVRQAYDDSVRYLSDIYSDIFDVLCEDFDYVVTLSDHGEMFGENGVWEHHHGIYPQLTHVPLSVYRSREERETRETNVSLLDVHRTVLDLAGLTDVPSRGTNLLDDEASRSYLVERLGLTQSQRERLKDRNASERARRRYDRTLRGIVLADGFYGWETVDGFKSEGEGDPEEAKVKVTQLVEKLDPKDVTSEAETDVPPDVRGRLEELGYL